MLRLQKSVTKLNGHVEEVQAAIDHEADKLKEFEADQTALKDRYCGPQLGMT